MKKFLFLLLLTRSFQDGLCQYTEPWSDPVPLTDAESYNSNPEVVVIGNETWMFYEKKFSPEGPVKIYFREIKSMGGEMELLGDTLHSFRNPMVVDFNYPDEGFCLYYESDAAGNFDLYALRFNAMLTFGDTFRLTFTPGDEHSSYYDSDYDFVTWIKNGAVLAARVIHDQDTICLSDTQTLDFTGCSGPACCAFRIVYLKSINDSNAVYRADWNWNLMMWDNPEPVDATGNSSHCSCDRSGWVMSPEDCIVYEKDSNLFSYFYDEIYPIELEGFEDNMHQPNSALYDIPVENLPAPLFVTFTSDMQGETDVYACWIMGWDPVENISQDTLLNLNPEFFWGWDAPGPCSRYFMDVWESEENGFRPLYMSKCALYVCGGTRDIASPGTALQVSPNPFDDLLRISYFPAIQGKYAIEIRDGKGMLIGQVHRMAVPGQWNETTFRPGKEVARGMMLITASQGGKRLFRKVIYN